MQRPDSYTVLIYISVINNSYTNAYTESRQNQCTDIKQCDPHLYCRRQNVFMEHLLVQRRHQLQPSDDGDQTDNLHIQSLQCFREWKILVSRRERKPNILHTLQQQCWHHCLWWVIYKLYTIFVWFLRKSNQINQKYSCSFLHSHLLFVEKQFSCI